MSGPNGYLIHGTAFSSKEAAFKALVSNHEQESWFQKIWDEDAKTYYFEPQHQLTIPKSIADELGGYFKYKNPFEAILRDYSVRSNDVIEELRDYLDFLHSNLELCIAYLAGKALGVDLVKVVEG
ncbi:hypothetical protein ACTCUF_08150 [Lactococcus lactis]|uniref:hypothetical protein n=1 Tax=Lactococcus lactis TaxID=1358 RepID=UPI003F8791CD